MSTSDTIVALNWDGSTSRSSACNDPDPDPPDDVSLGVLFALWRTRDAPPATRVSTAPSTRHVGQHRAQSLEPSSLARANPRCPQEASAARSRPWRPAVVRATQLATPRG